MTGIVEAEKRRQKAARCPLPAQWSFQLIPEQPPQAIDLLPMDLFHPIRIELGSDWDSLVILEIEQPLKIPS
jgi:hypothetical protein